MSLNNNHINSIYNSRTNILEILKERDFNIETYENFDINEIGILADNNQLDMLLTSNSSEKKVYVKYYINKIIKVQNIFSIVEDLFHLENLLNKNDDLIIIIKDEPNETLTQEIKNIWMAESIYISLLSIKRLQFNILKHNLVPKHIILSKEEENNFKKKFNILHNEQIPDISYFSPVSLVLGIRPDNIVKIERKSPTSITSDYYRICKI
jgi:DNA-directed RNA polymerases I, II, and III subunit RPABC1